MEVVKGRGDGRAVGKTAATAGQGQLEGRRRRPDLDDDIGDRDLPWRRPSNLDEDDGGGDRI